MKIRHNNKGVSLIAAVFIIVIVGFMGVIFVTMLNTSSFTSVNDLKSAQALYVAEGGIESAVTVLNTPNLANRIACTAVTGNANLTDEPLGQGQFTVLGNFFYSDPATALNGAITNAATIINVNATAGYASFGRIMIDKELIDYSGTTPGAFTNALRGRDGTIAAPHANGARVGQRQCSLTSTGDVPDDTASRARRTIREGVQLQEGWAVGAGGNILQWNGTGWVAYGVVVGSQLNSISMLSYADGWAVGNVSGGELILHWDGTNWARVGPVGAVPNFDLNSIYCISSNDCWAVGDVTGAGELIIHWNGAAWARFGPYGGVSNENLNGVHCVNNDCWAVGNSGIPGQRPLILWWDGVAAAWVDRNNGVNIDEDLDSIFCNAPNDCWAVGNAGGGGQRPLILWWNGAAWAIRNNPLNINENLNSIYCNAPNDCWAVGNAGGGGQRPLILWWNGAEWAVRNNPLNINANLNHIYCSVPNDCWAVGDAAAGELILHWDGTNWTRVGPDGAIPNVTLLNVNVIGPRTRPQAAWQEVVN